MNPTKILIAAARAALACATLVGAGCGGPDESGGEVAMEPDGWPEVWEVCDQAFLAAQDHDERCPDAFDYQYERCLAGRAGSWASEHNYDGTTRCDPVLAAVCYKVAALQDCDAPFPPQACELACFGDD